MKGAMILGTILMLVALFIQSFELSTSHGKDEFIKDAIVLLIEFLLAAFFVHMYRLI